MNTVDLIKKKRDGISFSSDEINFLIDQFTRGNIPDYQFSALLMAILLKGMNSSETAALTDSMLNSGKIINLSSLKGKKVDKHSTGGVGDKTITNNCPNSSFYRNICPYDFRKRTWTHRRDTRQA